MSTAAVPTEETMPVATEPLREFTTSRFVGPLIVKVLLLQASASPLLRLNVVS